MSGETLRDLAKGPLHKALHELGPRIPGLDVGDCHCNLLAEVALDSLMPFSDEQTAAAEQRGRQWAIDAMRKIADTYWNNEPLYAAIADLEDLATQPTDTTET